MLRQKIQELAFKFDHLWVLQNPLDFFEVSLLGRKRTLHFLTGLEYPCNKQNLEYAMTLIGLARLGVPLVSQGTQSKLEWSVDPIANVVTIPSGFKLSLRLAHSMVLAETFLYEIHYQGDDLSNELVFDIGANIGDTALYYASKGARVRALEPDPENFSALLANLELNPELASRIVPIQAAVGEDGAVPFHYGGRSGSGLFASGPVVEVRSCSLESLLREAKVEDAFLLKVDCKGCEGSLIRQRELRHFRRVAIEYTKEGGHGDPSEIIAALAIAGFGNIRIFKSNWASRPLTEHGMIRASQVPERP